MTMQAAAVMPPAVAAVKYRVPRAFLSGTRRLYDAGFRCHKFPGDKRRAREYWTNDDFLKHPATVIEASKSWLEMEANGGLGLVAWWQEGDMGDDRKWRRKAGSGRFQVYLQLRVGDDSMIMLDKREYNAITPAVNHALALQQFDLQRRELDAVKIDFCVEDHNGMVPASVNNPLDVPGRRPPNFVWEVSTPDGKMLGIAGDLNAANTLANMQIKPDGHILVSPQVSRWLTDNAHYPAHRM